ncbi:MAG: hypothetical protein R3Y54_11300 [Eubacteriales bacterium]
MKCIECGIEFQEGIFCPECGMKNGEVLSSKVDVQLEQVKLEQERLLKEKAEIEERITNQKLEQEHLEKNNMLEERTYKGVLYADELEARLAHEDHAQIDLLKTKLMGMKSQEKRQDMIKQFEETADIKTSDALRRVDLLYYKVSQPVSRGYLYCKILGLTNIITFLIMAILLGLEYYNEMIITIVGLWCGFGTPIWLVWRFILLIKSKSKNSCMNIKDI